MTQPKPIRKTPVLTVRDVAEYLHVDEKTVYRLVQRRELPGFKVAGTWRFRRDEIDGWIDASREGSAPRARGALRLRALVVEDDAVDRMTIRKAIRETDPAGAVDIVEVTGLEAARAALREGAFDCVVVDRLLPDGDGVSLLDEEGDPLGGAAVVVLTGLEDEEIARAALRRGAQDYLIKGRIEGHALLRSIRYAIERKRLEEQQRRYEGNFRSLIEQSPDAMCVFRGTRLIYTNPAFRRLADSDDGEAAEGLDAEELVHPGDVGALGALMAGAGTADSQRPLTELRLRGPFGAWILVEAWARPVLFDDEEAVLLSARDVTRRRQLEEQVAFSSRMAAVGTLAAGVAHEINNPLAYVIANLEFAINDLGERVAEAGAGDQRAARKTNVLVEALSEARQGACRINHIVRDMKALAWPHDAGDAPAPLRQAVELALGLVGGDVRGRARLVQEMKASPSVVGGAPRVGQIIMNLLTNAAQAIPEGKMDQNQITLVLDETPDRTMGILEVHDTGCGIPEENLQRIFHPFFTTKPVGSGTGLGLAVCHGLVTGLGGRITVESKVGVGTTFRVFLPVPAPKIAVTPPPEVVPGRRGRLLLVDDDERYTSALARTLSREHEVVTARNAREALARIDQEAPFHVVLCNLVLPDMSGLAFHTELAARAGGLGERLIFMTGDTIAPGLQEFLESVPNLRLEKPIDVRLLATLVRDRVPM